MIKWFLQTYGDVIVKITLCILLTGLIGYNREKNGTPIGIRTHILVGFSAVIIQITALRYTSINEHMDPMRLAGQFISGIAFLGTGTIMKEKGNIRGLTTASSIFFAACIGISIGTGMYIEAILVTLVAYAFLSDVIGLKEYLRSKGKRTVTIKIELSENCRCYEGMIQQKLGEIRVTMTALEIIMVSVEKTKIMIKVEADDSVSENELLMQLIEIPSTLKAEVLQG